MEKKAILQGYDDLLQGKRASANLAKVLAVTAILVVVSILVWAYFIHMSTINTIKVVDVSGKELKSNLVREEKMFTALAQAHLQDAVYYANSFNRTTIKENQSKTYFLMSKSDADRIFSMYKVKRSYDDALNRGVVYKTAFKELKSITGDKFNFHVVFTAIEEVIDNNNPIQRTLITGEGDLIPVDPQYPENKVGLYFKNYSQTYQQIQDEQEQ